LTVTNIFKNPNKQNWKDKSATY